VSSHQAPKTGAYIASTNKKFSINELHCRLGHVSHERARLLIRKGLVKGVELEANSEVVVCESCEWEKRIEEGNNEGSRGGEMCCCWKTGSFQFVGASSC